LLWALARQALIISRADLLDVSTIGLEVGSDANGALNITGTGQVRAQKRRVGVRDGSNGVINVADDGLLHSNDHITLGGDQSGGAGTLNMNGGVVETNYIASKTTRR
jgi:hypothetical protein